MPYIKDKFRDNIRDRAVLPSTPGELNFAITDMCAQYIQLMGGMQYATVNEVIGALECAKLELYRRLAAPYEDTKIAENGDVYPEELVTKP